MRAWDVAPTAHRHRVPGPHPRPSTSSRAFDTGLHHEEMPDEDHALPPAGGPCDLELRGETADQVIKAQDRHLREAVRAGDTAHEPAHEEMKGRWRRPLRAMGWYR